MMSQDDLRQKNLFVILGVPRSGTSVIARGLHALGIPFGDHLIPPNEAWNPKGFWEDEEIVYKINRGVLFALDHSWMSLPHIKNLCLQSDAVSNLSQKATLLLQKRFENTEYFGFKDPRTVHILPFWQAIFSTLHLQEHYVIALRNPLASAYSYQRVSQSDIEFGLISWLMHLIPAISETHHKRRIIVSYELMINRPHQELNRIQQYFNLPDLAESKERDIFSNEFLDKKLQHFDQDVEVLKSHEAVAIVPMCMKMYHLLLRIAKDEITWTSNEFLEEWQQIKTMFDVYYPCYCYMDRLLKQNKDLSKKIRTIKKSIPWKMIYPLRIVDDFLRKLRKQARAHRKLQKA